MQRVVFVLASGVASVLALGAVFFDSNVGIAQARKCPPGSTYEKPLPEYPAACTITQVGSPGNDMLLGSNDPRITDKMYGRGGDDRLYGYRGRDGLAGGSGQDTLYGGSGGDGLFGDFGRDTIYGGPGPDEVWDGGGGRDKVSTGAGADYIDSQDGERDIISCGPGGDEVRAGRLDNLKDCEIINSPFVPARGWWEALMASF